jgi:hypothetical protein
VRLLEEVLCMANAVPPDPLGHRRSTRVLVKIPLRLRGLEADGESFETSAETLLVNKHGARVYSQRALRLGTEVAVTVQGTERWQLARVVWEDQPGENIYGIELNCPQNLWGISFPPEDWDLAIQPVTADLGS